jgi:tetratricopeptide (TPR) repeat protein
MWKRRAEDAVHTIFTDHNIQRFKPNQDFLAPLAERSPAVTADKDLMLRDAQVLTPLEQQYFLGMAYLQLPPDQLAISESQRGKGIDLLQRFLGNVEQKSQGSVRQGSADAKYLSRAYLILAGSYRARRQGTLAIESTEHALEYDSGFALARNFKCGLLTELGKPQDAFECFQQALLLHPWDARVYRNIGSLYALGGSMDQAVTVFKQSLALDPESAESYHYVGDALTEQGDLNGAISAYEAALNLEPRDAETYWDSALVLQKAGKNGLARQYVKVGLRYAPGNSRGLQLLSTMSAVGNSGALDR